jgi:primosomal protein N' (replication factor Y)
LITQVAGRAGRRAKTGEVILQTYIPDHYAINQRSYETFYNHEIRYREALKYPPFYHMVNLIFTAKTSDEAGRYAQKSYLYLTSKLLKKGLQNELEIFHANPALLKKIDNVYRWQVIIKAKPAAFDALKIALKTLEEKFLEVKTCKISMDLDASNIL